nr:hypothetical protein [Sphingobacterium sp. E70]
MYRRNFIVTLDMAMQYGDIAKADQPLGMLLKRRKIDLVDNPNTAIAPRAANTALMDGSSRAHWRSAARKWSSPAN